MERINDIFVQNISGIPHVARCYGGNYCRIQPDRELVDGFFAAINSFKGELGQKQLNNVIYDQINLVFQSKGDLLVVCNIDSDADEDHFREVATSLQSKFIEDFGDPAETNLRLDHNFSQFIDWVDSQVGAGLADLRPLISSAPRGFLARIRSWFN